MRLLESNAEGEYSLAAKDFVDNIPTYAILSHTWGAEEVTFQELMDGSGKRKAGYKKIRFCGEQARRDGLQYFWVDTCCIDKSSSAELAEAINSMFLWYSRAAKCYAYLSDVKYHKRQLTWEPAFRNSKWFTRGWTLQELIAPQIHEITGIAPRVFRGDALNTFSIEERFSWAAKRQTTRKEDKAYCLLGVFGIYLLPIYGEEDNAFKRLREEISKPFKGLDRLPFAVDAPFNSYSKRHLPTCLPNTRVDLLQEICDWADRQDEDEQCIFWLNGLAGTGKSTIARTVASKYFDQGRLGASFFFSRGGGDVGHAGRFFTSLAVQLARNVPQIQQFVSNVIIEQDNIANQSLHDQWRQLVLQPLARLDSSSYPSSSMLIVVDALDECESEGDMRMILQCLTEAQTLKTVRLRVFLTSRPESPIRYGFYKIPDTKHQDFILHNISSSIIDHDISMFLQYNLDVIAGERSLGTGWPGEQIVERLVKNSSGLFIWAATACRFIREGKRFATKRLDIILERSGTNITAPDKHLNEIYLTVLRQSISPDYTDEEAEELRFIFKSLLGSIVTLFSPLSAQSLSTLVNISQEEVDQTLDDLHAILDIPKDQTSLVRLHHHSFRDFLLDKERCSDSRFQVDKRQAHQTLADSCIRLMSKSLKQDICRQQAAGRLVADLERSRREQYIPLDIEYACLYWAQHLQMSGTQPDDNGRVHQFLQVHLLHWLEVLGWIGKASEGILAILSLEALILADKSPNLYAFIHDARRFALYNRSIIEQAPLQLYCSALVFAPEKSLIRGQFENSIPSWIQRKPKVQTDWSAAIQTLEGHSQKVTSVALSPNGKHIVSGSWDMTVRLWDAVTGAALQRLEDHSDCVTSVAFSPDSKQIISGSWNRTVRRWDAATGAALQTLEGHSGHVTSVAFSPNGKQIVSASRESVRLWDAVTGVALQVFVFDGYPISVNSVAFLPDSRQIVAKSDHIIQLWDTVTGTILQTFECYSACINSVAFSPNGQQIVSGSNDKTVRLWDAMIGTALQSFEGHSGYVLSVAFSPSGKQIVSASGDGTVRLWDAMTGSAPQALESWLTPIYSVAFSPDGKQVVSKSWKTVFLWDAITGALLQTFTGHSKEVDSVAFSPDGRQVVSGSKDNTVRLWDTATGAVLQTLEGHLDSVEFVVFSPNSKQIVSGSQDRTVRLWDAIAGVILQTIKCTLFNIKLVAFSPDGTQILSGSVDNTILLWDAVTGTALQSFEGHSDSPLSVAFSPSSKQIASASWDKTVRLWDTMTGTLLYAFESHLAPVPVVAFSPNGKQIVSASYDMTVRLWDTVTGAALQTLKSSSMYISTITFAPDSKQIVARSDSDRTVQLWDAVTDTAIQTPEAPVNSVVFSPDGRNGFFVSEDWVVEGKEKILWLPLEYRTPCQATYYKATNNKAIVLGYLSWELSILEFRDGAKHVGE